jgi:hypothetical protein
VSQYYPDLSDDEDLEDRNLWPEGLAEIEPRSAYVNLAVNLDMLDPGVMTVVAQSAARASLSILDEQNGLLYLPTCRVIGVHDTAPQPLPPITPIARQLMTETVGELRLRATQQKVAEAARVALGADFQRFEAAHVSVVWRQHGELRQMLEFGTMRSTDHVSTRLYVSLGFASEALAGRYMAHLPKSFAARRSRYDRDNGGAAAQVRWFLPDLARGEPVAQLRFSSESKMRFVGAADVDALVEASRTWLPQTLKPFLDRIGTLEDLRALSIVEARLQHCRKERLSFPRYAALLALARLTSLDTLEAYAAAMAADGKVAPLSKLFKEPDDRHFEQLVEGLRAGA